MKYSKVHFYFYELIFFLFLKGLRNLRYNVPGLLNWSTNMWNSMTLGHFLLGQELFNNPFLLLLPCSYNSQLLCHSYDETELPAHLLVNVYLSTWFLCFCVGLFLLPAFLNLLVTDGWQPSGWAPDIMLLWMGFFFKSHPDMFSCSLLCLEINIYHH